MLTIIEPLWMCSIIYSDTGLKLVKFQDNEIERCKLKTQLYVSYSPSMLRDLGYITTKVLEV